MPTAFVTLSLMPRLSGSNKIDRRSLPVPDPSALGRAEAYVAPRDDRERRLVKLWESLLHVEPIGIRDDFFDLGGDSLTAGQMFAGIKDHFGVRLAPSALVRSATVEGSQRFSHPAKARIRDENH